VVYGENNAIGEPMARPNYAFAKHQREIAKKQKKEAKRQKKAELLQEKPAADKPATTEVLPT
jgi:hypothetical protein